jgi:hypothetical protein
MKFEGSYEYEDDPPVEEYVVTLRITPHYKSATFTYVTQNRKAPVHLEDFKLDVKVLCYAGTSRQRQCAESTYSLEAVSPSPPDNSFTVQYDGMDLDGATVGFMVRYGDKCKPGMCNDNNPDWTEFFRTSSAKCTDSRTGAAENCRFYAHGVPTG